MTVSRPVFALAMACAAVGGTWLAAHGPSRAQEPVNVGAGRAHHIADDMLRPVRLPFGGGATLEEVAAYLRKELKANVVLDLAALGRQNIEPGAKIKIELENVRLKTGLKLLLDQVGLTTRVVAEDNLLIFTDKAEGDEPIARVLDEVKALHRDVHSLQDEVRDVRDLLEMPPDDEPVAKMRNPTIIEEKPAEPGQKEAAPEEKARPRERSSRSRPGA